MNLVRFLFQWFPNWLFLRIAQRSLEMTAKRKKETFSLWLPPYCNKNGQFCAGMTPLSCQVGGISLPVDKSIHNTVCQSWPGFSCTQIRKHPAVDQSKAAFPAEKHRELFCSCRVPSNAVTAEAPNPKFVTTNRRTHIHHALNEVPLWHSSVRVSVCCRPPSHWKFLGSSCHFKQLSFSGKKNSQFFSIVLFFTPKFFLIPDILNTFEILAKTLFTLNYSPLYFLAFRDASWHLEHFQFLVKMFRPPPWKEYDTIPSDFSLRFFSVNHISPIWTTFEAVWSEVWVKTFCSNGGKPEYTCNFMSLTFWVDNHHRRVMLVPWLGVNWQQIGFQFGKFRPQMRVKFCTELEPS